MRTLVIFAVLALLAAASAIAAYELRTADSPARIDPIQLKPAREAPKRTKSPKPKAATRPSSGPTGGAAPAAPAPAPAGEPSGGMPAPSGGDDANDDAGDDDGDDGDDGGDD